MIKLHLYSCRSNQGRLILRDIFFFCIGLVTQLNSSVLGVFRHRFRGRCGGALPPLFLAITFLCVHFEELQTVLNEVKLIIDNAPLTYVYPITTKTYLTPNHLLFGRQLSCYSNTRSTVVRNLTAPASTADRINRISNHFWHRWRHESVVNLCETQQASKLNINSQEVMLC